MMDAILDGRSFVQAVDAGYHQDVRSLWQKLLQPQVERRFTPFRSSVVALACSLFT